ncbi:hypothetical protein KC19_3G111300 [Ceratodon purpureus]|uniref:ubiquitinyl hydrolase 1 n=2 Tax=Ceratodon purpureus TaxID=3225 RepID=A0A8T0IKP2_CERPU|nr:hypothetical protein KC19_3G110700 [Ceratodon purpureus]KAG0583125.1 hypothetical protein KC19_3G111300 [Ceratodon purpureus]
MLAFKSREMAAQPRCSSMDYIQLGGYVDYFNNSDAVMWRQERYPVSFSVEKESEPKYWDGGRCEVVGEGTYDGEYKEGEGGQEWGVIGSGPNSPHAEYEAADDHDLQLAMALSEEDPQMGDELAKRLSHMNSIPHVPRVNSDIPLGDSWSDKERLSDRISYYGLAERQMDGDGNCQFRALSDQLYRTPDHHMSVRAQVVSQLAEAPDSYSSHVPMDYNQYLENMARDGEWGDHVTLQAAADFFGMKISLITSFKDSCFIEIIPVQQKSQRGLFLSFWSEIHYNSIIPLEGSADFTDKKKKKKWFSSD